MGCGRSRAPLFPISRRLLLLRVVLEEEGGEILDGVLRPAQRFAAARQSRMHVRRGVCTGEEPSE